MRSKSRQVTKPVSVIHGVIAAKTNLTVRGAFESPYTGPVYIVDAVQTCSRRRCSYYMGWLLIGMIGKELLNTQTNTWVNHVMPASELRETVEKIISGRFTSRKPDDEDEDGSTRKRPLRYESADFGIVTIPDVVARTPAYIDRILPGSLAEKAGLQPTI